MNQKSEIPVAQSLLDRLMTSDEWPRTRLASITMYRESLKRDIEDLLNTRQPIIPKLDSFPAVASSVVNLGLPDIHSFTGSSESALLAALEKTIKTFEPRIHDPKVSLTRLDSMSRRIGFLVEGQIVFEDFIEPIRLDTVLELISGYYEVK